MHKDEEYLLACRGEAISMINAFAGVGVERMDVTLTDIDQQLRAFRPNQSIEVLKRSVPHLIRDSFARENNVIVRPRPANGIALAQLDDLDVNQAARLQPVSFLLLHTSENLYQAWIAISDGTNEIVKRLIKGLGADPRASGAVRLAGTANFKRKYEPDFPIVDAFGIKAICSDSGSLESLGLLAIPEPPWPAAPPALRPSNTIYSGPRRWPSYADALNRASLKPDGGRDRSQADFVWCLWAVDRGWSVDETAAELLVQSEKAQQAVKRGDKGYCRLTAWKASLCVRANRSRTSRKTVERKNGNEAPISERPVGI